MLMKSKRWKSKKWTDEARDQPCTMRLIGHCNGNPETTVFAHANGAGMGMKTDDYNGADMCSDCHDAFDGRVDSHHSKPQLLKAFENARYETIVNRLERGIVK